MISSPYRESSDVGSLQSASCFTSVRDRIDLTHDLIQNTLASEYINACLPLLIRERVLPISKAFIPVSLKRIGRPTGDVLLSNIFPQRLPQSYHAIIQGRSGFGKSTLLKFFNYCSVRKEGGGSVVAEIKKWTDLFRGIITIPMKTLSGFEPRERFSDAISSTEKGWLAEFLLKNVFDLMDNDQLGATPSERADNLLNALDDIEDRPYLFVLEGYDEFSSSSSIQAKEVLKQLIAKPYWIITSRPGQVPASIESQVFRELKDDKGAVFELLEFCDDKVSCYIDFFYNSINSTKAAREQISLSEALECSRRLTQPLKDFIEQSPALKSLCRVPLCLEMLCHVWEEQASSMQGLTNVVETQLYYYVLVYLAARGLEVRELSLDDHAEDELLSVFDQELKVLQRLAFDMITSQTKLIFTDNLEKAKEGFSVKREALYDLSLFTITKAEALRFQKNHSFIHNSILEFFAACELIRRLASGDEAVQRVAKAWVSRRKYVAYYQYVLSFAAALTVLNDQRFCWFGSINSLARAKECFWQAIEHEVDIISKQHYLLRRVFKSAMGSSHTEIPGHDLLEEGLPMGATLYRRDRSDVSFEQTFRPGRVDVASSNKRKKKSKKPVHQRPIAHGSTGSSEGGYQGRGMVDILTTHRLQRIMNYYSGNTVSSGDLMRARSEFDINSCINPRDENAQEELMILSVTEFDILTIDILNRLYQCYETSGLSTQWVFHRKGYEVINSLRQYYGQLDDDTLAALLVLSLLRSPYIIGYIKEVSASGAAEHKDSDDAVDTEAWHMLVINDLQGSREVNFDEVELIEQYLYPKLLELVPSELSQPQRQLQLRYYPGIFSQSDSPEPAQSEEQPGLISPAVGVTT